LGEVEATSCFFQQTTIYTPSLMLVIIISNFEEEVEVFTQPVIKEQS
jgi:hypothetical protein